MWQRIRSLCLRQRLDRELAEEIETHLAMQEAVFRRQGMSPDEARLAARREFGGVTKTMETCRERRGIRWVETILSDVRYALRGLRRNPGFAVAAIGTLALGIAVNATIFSVVDGVLLRPLPYRDSDRIVFLWTTNPRQSVFERSTGYLNVQDWREAKSFEGLTWFRNEPLVLKSGPEPEQIDAAFVSPGFFGLLGVNPALGRLFTAEEADRGEHLAVLDYGLWQRRFGGSPSVIGKVLRIESLEATVVGVLPAGFRPVRQTTGLYMPHTSATFFNEIRSARDLKFGWNVLAKLRRGIPLQQAQVEMDGIGARLAAAWPESNAGHGIRVVSVLEQVTGHVRLALFLLLAAVGLVQLIACINLGSLLLARAAGREREAAVRASLGATRARLIGQVLSESVLLAVIAAACGFALAGFGLRLLLTVAPSTVPRLSEVSLNFRALLFAVVVSLLSALSFGLAPALRLAGKVAPAQRTLGATHSARRFRNGLVVSECAVAIVLLAGAGLLVRSLASVLHVDPGFQAASVLTVELHSPGQNDPLSPPRLRQLLEEIEALPGIETAGAISRYFQSNVIRQLITIEGQPPLDSSQAVQVNYDVIAGDYFQALGVPLLRGRYFTRNDGPDAARVAIVNHAFVRAFLPGQDPIGKVFHRAGDSTPYAIIGVIGDTRRQDVTDRPIPEVLWPHAQRPWGMNLAIQVAGDPLKAVTSVRSAIHRFEPAAVVADVATLDQRMDQRIALRRFQTWLLTIFAAMGLVLAMIGVYGLMHYSVAERRQEIGIRIALGARPWDVLLMVVKHAATLASIGIAAGSLAALWVTRLLAGLLYGVSAHDPLTYGGALVLLAAAALGASVFPAIRAAGCDPLATLRQE